MEIIPKDRTGKIFAIIFTIGFVSIVIDGLTSRNMPFLCFAPIFILVPLSVIVYAFLSPRGKKEEVKNG